MRNMKRLKPRFIRYFVLFMIPALIIAAVISALICKGLGVYYSTLVEQHSDMYDFDRYDGLQLDVLASEYQEQKDGNSDAGKRFFEDAAMVADRLSYDGTVYYTFSINSEEIFTTAGLGSVTVSGKDGMNRKYRLADGDFWNWYRTSGECVKNGSTESWRRMFKLMRSGQEQPYGFSGELNLFRDPAEYEAHSSARDYYVINDVDSVFDAMLDPDLCVVHAYDIYVSGDQFVPGKVGLFDADGNQVRDYDFTPDNTGSYTHIIADDDIQIFDVYNLFEEAPKYSKVAESLSETGRGWTFTGHYLQMPSLFRIYPVRMAVLISAVFLFFIGIAALITGFQYKSAMAIYHMVEYRIKTTKAMAHDLKTPLATLSAYAENLKEEKDPVKMRDYADSIMTTIDSANHLVENILDFSKSEADSIRIIREKVELKELILSCIDENKDILKSNGIEITAKGPDVTLNTDRKILAQALGNLIQNCAKHSTEGTAEIEWDNKGVKVSNPSDLDIKDINELKKPFVKGMDSRNSRGTGLGLAIADNNLDMLGYELKLSREDNRFIVTVRF